MSETWRNLRLAHADPIVFRTLLGISWMWFFGAMFLAQFPAFAKEVLHGDERVASLLLVVFSFGIGGGSLLCEVLSRRQVDIGLVPLGAIGMSVFSIDLAVAAGGLPPASGTMSVAAFAAQPAHWRLMADLALLAASAGLYSVPMYALIQLRTGAGHRARIIAANNILNALFMIASSVLAGLLLQRGLTMPQVFLAGRASPTRWSPAACSCSFPTTCCASPPSGCRASPTASASTARNTSRPRARRSCSAACAARPTRCC